MDLGLTDRVAIVTGGASNIGRAISHELAAEGAVIALFDRDAPMAARTAEEIESVGGRVTTYTVDLTDVAATEAAAAAVESDLGPVQVLVNNVGWSAKAQFFLDIAPERWDETYRRNLFPTLNATRAVLPAMVERRRGVIVSISSDAGFGEHRVGDYGAMKAGVMAFGRTIAKEYGRYGIRSNVVCPGLVIPERDAIGEGSLWNTDDTGFGDKQIRDIEANIPLRQRPEAADVRRHGDVPGLRTGPDAHRPGRQRLWRLRDAALSQPARWTFAAGSIADHVLRVRPSPAALHDGGSLASALGTIRTMSIVGWHASHEQIPPSELLAAARWAQDAGFDAGMSSDHFSPWSERQGESGFAWSWLGAALATTQLPFGIVTAPGQRYHPAIVAQAIATLTEMFPGRLWVALGTGEASNEHITGGGWPGKSARKARLAECVDVMRTLFAGDEVTHRGHVVVDRARLWTLPPEPPPLIGAAVSPATASWVGGWADGLVTVNQQIDALRAVLQAFRSGGGDGKPAYLQVHVSWAPSGDEALAIAHDQWRTNVFDPPICWDLETPAHFDHAASYVRPDDVRRSVLVSSEAAWHRDRLTELVELGFDGVWIHHVGKQQRQFLEVFGEEVVPQLRSVA